MPEGPNFSYDQMVHARLVMMAARLYNELDREDRLVFDYLTSAASRAGGGSPTLRDVVRLVAAERGYDLERVVAETSTETETTPHPLGPAFIGLYATEEENADREVRVILDSEVVVSVTIKDGAPAEAYVFDRKSETMLAERDFAEREAELREVLPKPEVESKTIHVYGSYGGPDVRLVCPWGEGSGYIPPPAITFIKDGAKHFCSFRRTIRE